MRISRYMRVAGSLLTLLVLISAGASGPVHAVGRSDQVGSDYCGSIDTRANAVQARIDDKLSTLSSVWKAQDEKLTMLNSSQASAEAALRSSIDAERSKNIADLRAKARTDAERQAVDAYASAVGQAVQARRQVVDEARAIFKNSLLTIISERQATLSGQAQALKLGVADAYATAQNNCSDAMPANQVRVSLLQALAAARQHYQSERTDDPTVGQQIRQLIADRQASVTSANDTFNTATATARQTLKAAFGADAGKI